MDIIVMSNNLKINISILYFYQVLNKHHKNEYSTHIENCNKL